MGSLIQGKISLQDQDTDGVCLNKGHQVKCVYHVIERIVILGLSCLEAGGGGV